MKRTSILIETNVRSSAHTEPYDLSKAEYFEAVAEMRQQSLRRAWDKIRRLRDEYNHLKAENIALSSEVEQLTKSTGAAMFLTLTEEMAELRKNDARYRWLKEKGLYHSIDAATAAITPGVGPFICVQFPSSGAPNSIRLAASADEYIDLAMSKETEG